MKKFYSLLLSTFTLSALLASCSTKTNTEQTISLTVYKKGVAANPDWAAFQDGTGAWQTITGTAGVFKLKVSNGKYGFATSCGSVAKVWQSTVADNLTEVACLSGSLNTTVTVSGTVVGGAVGNTLKINGGSFTLDANQTFGPISVVKNSQGKSVIVAVLKNGSTRLIYKRTIDNSVSTDKFILDFTDSNYTFSTKSIDLPIKTIAPQNASHLDIDNYAINEYGELAAVYEGRDSTAAGISNPTYTISSFEVSGLSYRQQVSIHTPTTAPFTNKDFVITRSTNTPSASISLPTTTELVYEPKTTNTVLTIPGSVFKFGKIDKSGFSSLYFYNYTSNAKWNIILSGNWLNGATNYTVPNFTNMPTSISTQMPATDQAIFSVEKSAQACAKRFDWTNELHSDSPFVVPCESTSVDYYTYDYTK